MIWSYSAYRQFSKCERQWYYRNIVANARSKRDPYRREMAILSKLKSLDAWRGSVADKVISNIIIAKIRKGKELKQSSLVWVAEKIFDEQFEYANKRKYREPGVKFSDEDDFAALLDIDNGLGISKENITRAKNDVKDAILNFISNKNLIDELSRAKQLISQRSLIYKFGRFSIRGVPDLISFYDSEPPHIFDWKVHTFGTKTYDIQLTCYAIALNRANAHKDFPNDFSKYQINDYKLSEFQLLKNEYRHYQVSNDSIEQVESLMSSSIINMFLAGANKSYDELVPSQFRTTYDPRNCKNCPFQKICKEHEN